MIPQKLHYFWLEEIPSLPLWILYSQVGRKYLSDFEIIEWNEDNFNISQNQFAQDAYNKKWAFVSRLYRAKVLYEEGGFYLDRYGIKTLGEFVKYKVVCGFETKKVPFSAFWAVEPYHIFGKRYTKSLWKVKPTWTLHQTQNFFWIISQQIWGKCRKDEIQELKKWRCSFPSSYFSF